MRLAAFRLAVAASLGLCCCGDSNSSDEGSCSAAGGEICAGASAKTAEAAKPVVAASRRHFWPNKGGNLNVSGHSDVVFDKRLDWGPSWSWRPPAIVHSSPVIDDEGNVYIADTEGRITSLTRMGMERWRFQAACRNAGVPALHGDWLYDFCGSGIAFSLSLETGKVRWSRKIALGGPADAGSVVVYQNTVIMPVNLDMASNTGSCHVVGLNAEDGALRWNYSICKRAGVPSFNTLPAVVDSMVLVNDQFGGMHAFSVEDGTPRWHRAGYSDSTMSTGTAAVGPNNFAYCGAVMVGESDAEGVGLVRAHDIYTGQVAWESFTAHSINAGVAVGYLGEERRLAVIVATSDNFMRELSWWQALVLGVPIPSFLKPDVLRSQKFRGEIVAFDAVDGRVIWRHTVGVKEGWGYPGMERGCFPDAFGALSVDGKGAVSVNWSAGFAIRIFDKNSDGVIDEKSEVQAYQHSFGTNGQTALAPGLLVASSCEGIFGWVE